MQGRFQIVVNRPCFHNWRHPRNWYNMAERQEHGTQNHSPETEKAGTKAIARRAVAACQPDNSQTDACSDGSVRRGGIHTAHCDALQSHDPRPRLL